MKSVLLSLFLIGFLLPAAAQESGIRFFQGNWEEALALARKENKKIFADFYTTWCGPCLGMAREIFPLPEVGEVYNKHFVCLKIDAEKGEGPMLKKKYGVGAYPTFIFVNPEDGKVVHRSVGARKAADFIADARGALESRLSSVYLDGKYRSGVYDTAFLKDYIRGNKAAGNRRAVFEAFDKLLARGAKLTEPDVWQLYAECIDAGYVVPWVKSTGYKIPCIGEISDHYEQFVGLFGKKAVDRKLAEGTQYAPVALIGRLCDFEGKEDNLKISRMAQVFREKGFDEGWDAVDVLLADTTVDRMKLAEVLSFYTFSYPRFRNAELSFGQLLRKMRYIRYVAYNMSDREKAWPHYAYAKAWEDLVRRSLEENEVLPADILAVPVYGKKEYTLMSPLLAPKPAKK